MTTPPREEPLDGFERALLTQLKDVAAAQGAAARSAAADSGRMPHPSPAVRSPLRRPAVRLAAAAAAVAAGVGGYLLSPAGSSPAFAVTTDAGGDVTVQVNRLEGADALEKALADKGIHADVSFPSKGMHCRDGRFTDAGAPSTQPGHRVVMSAETSRSGGQTITIPKSAVGPRQTLVLESMWPTPDIWAMRVGITDGAVSPCVEEAFVSPPGMREQPPPGGPGTTGSATQTNGQPSSVTRGQASTQK